MECEKYDERKLTFSYKNNTDYTIAYIELTFTRKDMVLDDSNSDINIYQWSSNDMAKKTAKPNFDYVVVNSDDNVYFSFNGYGVSRRQFEAYVEKVKTKFSDIETDDSDIEYFEAKNNNGDEIELSYNASEQEVTCTISNDNVMSGDEDDTESTTEATTTTTAKKVTTTVKKKDTQTSGIRPRIKKAIDSYEKVMYSYCEFMKKYNKSSDTSSMIKDYADYMEKYSDAVEKFQKIKNDNLNSDELSYYTEIQVRVTKKFDKSIIKEI